MGRSKKKYELTTEHRARLPEFRDKWIANAMSCKAMDDADREAMRRAIHGMYAAAKLAPPKNIVFVPSPIVLALAWPIAAGVWYLRKNRKFAESPRSSSTRAATRAATEAATSAATLAATWAATRDATRDATWAATKAATWDATWAAIRAATMAATWDATEAAIEAATSPATMTSTWVIAWAEARAAAIAANDDVTWAVTRDAIEVQAREATWDAIRDPTRDATMAATRAAAEAATDHNVARFLTGCIKNYWNAWDGGNQGPGVVSLLSFFKDVANIGLVDFSAFAHYESAAIHGGPRAMTPDFVMVSDRPERLMVDDRNRPHCEDGPFCRWRDGTELYYWHGTKVTRDIIMHPDRITMEQIKSEQNAEVRRVMRERYGNGRYLKDIGAKLIDADYEGAKQGAAPRALLEDDDGRRFLVVTDGSTGRVYYLEVPPEVKTCAEGHAALCGFDESRIKVKS